MDQLLDSASASELVPAADVVFSVSGAGLITYMSDSVRGVLGRAPSALVGSPYTEPVHPRDRGRAEEAWGRLAAGKRVSGLGLTFVGPNGREMLGVLDAAPRFDASGRFLGAHGVARPTAAGASTPHETIVRHPAVLDADTCWIVMVEGTEPLRLRAIALLGPDARDLARLAAEGMEGSDPAATAMRLRSTVVQDTGGSEAPEVPWLAEAGRRGYGCVAVAPMAYGGRLLGLVYACGRQAGFFDGWRALPLETFAHAGAAAEVPFRAIVEHLPCVVYMALPSWPPRFLFMSANVEQFTGVSSEEACADSQALFSIIHPDDRERVWQCARDAVCRNAPYALEYRVVHRNGRDVYHAAHRSVPVAGEGGQVLFRYGIIVDVTEQKRLEAQLIQSQRLAVIGEMAAMMAHEIRNPLAGMSLALRALRSPDRDAALEKECLDDLEHCLWRINETVSRALDFARGRPIQPRQSRLADVVASALRLTATTLRRSRVRVEEDLPADLPDFVADPDELQHVFVNLVLNASKAMPQGGLLTIRAWSDAGRLFAEVADTGVGISAEQLPRVFDPFRSGFAEGAGLGLALSQRILAAHGGTLSVESTLGQGSTFRLDLPLEPADGPRAPG